MLNVMYWHVKELMTIFGFCRTFQTVISCRTLFLLYSFSWFAFYKFCHIIDVLAPVQALTIFMRFRIQSRLSTSIHVGRKETTIQAANFILFIARGSVFLLMGVHGIGLYGYNKTLILKHQIIYRIL